MHGDPWAHSDIGSSLASKLSIDINGAYGLIAHRLNGPTIEESLSGSQ